MRYILLVLLTTLFFSCNSRLKETASKEVVHHTKKTNHEANNHDSHDHGAHKGHTVQLKDDLTFPQEKHFKNMKQITFGGDNAEAYWSFDNKKLVFQAKNPKWGAECDRIYVMDVNDTFENDKIPQLVSTGTGRTTCSYFLPGDTTIIYASTHLAGQDCPPEPDRSLGYVWPVYDSYDIFIADLKGNIIKQLTNEPGYDAEPTVSPKGDKIVFTSTRTGDLELFTMDIDGSNVNQVTNGLGYDGGAFFFPDGEKLIFRSSRPKTPEEVAKYKGLLAQGLVEPSDMELYMVNVDGTDLKQITHLGNANWAPFMHPNGKKVIFSSNHKSKRGFPFNLFMINIDGTGLEQITYGNTFAAFPMFSFDGKKFVFSSNRNNEKGSRDTNMFIADWVD